MYKLLVKLMLLAALTELGASLTELRNIRAASNKVLEIHWRPISLFPEEAKRFQR